MTADLGDGKQRNAGMTSATARRYKTQPTQAASSWRGLLSVPLGRTPLALVPPSGINRMTKPAFCQPIGLRDEPGSAFAAVIRIGAVDRAAIRAVVDRDGPALRGMRAYGHTPSDAHVGPDAKATTEAQSTIKAWSHFSSSS